MDSKKETLIEKLLKPIRINPITLGISLAGFGIGALLLQSDDTLTKLSSAGWFGLGSSSLLVYFKYGVDAYRRDRKTLAKHGFDIRYGKLRMGEYCDRQAFYVACIEKGYKKEAKTIINDTPNEQKRLSFLPHI